MTKSRFCCATKVFLSRRMQQLPFSAQALYMRCCAESNLIGEIEVPSNVVNSRVGAREDFEMLVDAGFLIVFDDGWDDRCFVTHHFVSNGFKNKRQKASALTMYREVEDFLNVDCKLDAEGLPTFSGAYELA